MGEPTIQVEHIEQRYREAMGDRFQCITCKPRKGRSEKLTVVFSGGGKLEITSRAPKNADTVRKAALQLLDDMQAAATEAMRKLRVNMGVDDG